ncbi:alpha/beta fold hydrolase [Virgibacillus oceani]
MNSLYGMDSPLIALNIVLWISLMFMYSKVTKNTTIIDFNKHRSVLIFTYLIILVNLIIVFLVLFNFSFYAEPPRNMIHVSLMLMPTILWGIFYLLRFIQPRFLSEQKMSIRNSIGTVILQWGIIVLFIDVIFYLFPYGYLTSNDYALLLGVLVLSLVITWTRNVFLNKKNAAHTSYTKIVSAILTIAITASMALGYFFGAIIMTANFYPEQIQSDRHDVQTGFVENEDASLYYEIRGDGPPLLLVSGGGGDADFYKYVADELADDYKVITYDRRGNSRSVWGAPHNVDVAQQGRDAAAVLEATNTEIADIYGNSSGAIIAMELATVFPEMVNTVVIHEPPLVKVLPDKDKWLAFFANIHSTTTRLGPEIANTKFTFSVGVPLSAFSYIPEDFQERNAENTDILMQDEMQPFIQYQPDIQKLIDSKVHLVFAAGDLSLHKEKYFARTSLILSKEFQTELALFPGHHLSYFDSSNEWADALKDALTN